MSEFVKIAAPEKVEVQPFRFEINGKRFELPALTEKTVPLELIPLLLIARSEQVEEEQLLQVGSAFLSYLKADHPKLWRHLKSQDQSLEWINGVMLAWIEHGDLDPKA